MVLILVFFYKLQILCIRTDILFSFEDSHDTIDDRSIVSCLQEKLCLNFDDGGGQHGTHLTVKLLSSDARHSPEKSRKSTVSLLHLLAVSIRTANLYSQSGYPSGDGISIVVSISIVKIMRQ